LDRSTSWSPRRAASSARAAIEAIGDAAGLVELAATRLLGARENDDCQLDALTRRVLGQQDADDAARHRQPLPLARRRWARSAGRGARGRS
jgi:hypothetical protein